MKTLFNKIMHKISLSVIQGNPNSTPRIQAFILLLPILLMSLTFVGFEIAAFIICMKNGSNYNISAEIIVVFGMILSHHLALIFSRKTSQSISEIKTGTTKNEVPDEIIDNSEESN